jgi:hypothetical protein
MQELRQNGAGAKTASAADRTKNRLFKIRALRLNFGHHFGGADFCLGNSADRRNDRQPDIEWGIDLQ